MYPLSFWQIPISSWGEQIMPTSLLLAPPGISDLPTALFGKNTPSLVVLPELLRYGTCVCGKKCGLPVLLKYFQSNTQ